MTDKPTWMIKPHTRAKHVLLRRYLGAWFPILTSGGYNRRIIYIDGFAGPGIYSDGELGSPLIALDTLVNHSVFHKLSETEFIFVFVEAERKYFENLENEISKFWNRIEGGRPSNIRLELFNSKFKDVADEIIDTTYGQGKQLAPTFAFVDPFGWSGVPLTTIRDLLSSDKCEVLFSFMYDSITRFITTDDPNLIYIFNELFGTDENEYNQVKYLFGEERKVFLHDLYKNQLERIAGFEFVRSFDFVDSVRGKTVYFLMFGTRHRKGLEVMKEAMWSLDPIQGYSFTGWAGDQHVLFAPEPDVTPLRVAILDRFAGKTVPVETIEEFVVMDTDYKKSHYKKQILKVLELEGLVTCESERKINYTYTEGTVLSFKAAADTHSSAPQL